MIKGCSIRTNGALLVGILYGICANLMVLLNGSLFAMFLFLVLMLLSFGASELADTIWDMKYEWYQERKQIEIMEGSA